MLERWLDIKGFEGRYQVSDLGRVRSLKRWHRKRTLYLKGLIDKYGYLHVVLWSSGRPQKWLIHRLVLAMFVGLSSLQTNHKDTNKQNNRLSNLEYATPLENTQHAIQNGLSKYVSGEKHWKAKLSTEQIVQVRALEGKLFHREIAAKFGVSRACITVILGGKRRIT